MYISYEEILHHVQSNESHYNTILTLIETILRTAQDMKNVPIYSTKRRVKTVNSVYLKTKRDKVQSLTEINDYAGFRILSLFEQDFLDIHTCIIEELKKAGFDLKEFRLFNWKEDDQLIISMIDIIKEIYGDINIVPREKDYKSIHYMFNYNSYFVEIQLRTLLQDVWAELEHALSYKQINVHPHIKKSFALLGRDLQTNDNLVSHLKLISDKERVGHLYSMEKGGPSIFYKYESELIPVRLTTEPIKGYFDNYINFFAEEPRINLRKDKRRCAEARVLFEKFSEQIPDDIKETDDKIKYILNMEEAFLNFWEGDEGKLDCALAIYERIKKPFAKNYMLHFRMGEIYFIKGEIEKALVSFDSCESLIGKEPADILNRYAVKMKLAYIYWLLGKQYIEFTLKTVDEAEKIFTDNPGSFSEAAHVNLLNNLCAYYFDNYLITKNKYLHDTPKEAKDIEIINKSYDDALAKLSELEKVFNIEKATPNVLDTIAWFYFNIYLNNKKNNREKLEIAKKYCQLIGDRAGQYTYSTFKITNLNILKNHIQEIMSEK